MTKFNRWTWTLSIILCVFLVASVRASTFDYWKEVSGEPDGQKSLLVFGSEEQKVLEDYQNAFIQWKLSLGEVIGNTRTQVLPLTEENYHKLGRVTLHGENGLWQLDASQILPQKILDWNLCFTTVCYSGPNCWNCSFSTNTILESYHYIDGDLFGAILDSPWCEERKVDEATSPGDIIALRSRWGGEVHGFIHLTDDLVFTKNGYSKYSGYEFQDKSEVFGIYGVHDKSCFRQPAKNPDPSCYSYGNYYHCKNRPFRQFFQYYQAKWDELEKLAKGISRYCLYGNEFDSQSYEEGLRLIDQQLKDIAIADQLDGQPDDPLLKEELRQKIYEMRLITTLLSSLYSALTCAY